MIKINVILNNSNWIKYLRNPNSFIDKKIELINKKNKLFKKNILICSLVLSGPLEIKRLNKKFRSKNKSTDVLSFPFYEKNKLKNKFKKEKEIYLGDIIINLNKIKNIFALRLLFLSCIYNNTQIFSDYVVFQLIKNKNHKRTLKQITLIIEFF